MPANALELATCISSCPEVQEAKSDKSHPCFKVVNEQSKLIDLEIKRQRPEPWMGGLSTANLLFVSSNPSINEDPYPLGEVFPTYEWDEQASGEFFVDRVDPNEEKVKVTFQKAGEPNFLTLCHDGEYRSGVSNPKRPQPTWKNTHDRAVELIGPHAHPHHDYAITEIVHCKSKDARGVEEASQHCVEKWMGNIFETSPARVVVLLGSKVRDFYAIPMLSAGPNFGRFENYGSITQEERSIRDIFIANVGGTNRVFVFNWHPTFAGLRIYKKVYGEKVTSWLSGVIRGELPVPAPEELPRVLTELFR